MEIGHKETFLCLTQNIRSIRRNFDSLLLELSNLETLPICIVLTETWIYSEEMDNYTIDNYNCYANCNDDYRSGGVAVYIKSDIEVQFSKISLISADGVKTTFKVNDYVFCLIALYRFQNLPVEMYIDELSDYLRSITDKTLIYTGDINIDTLKSNALVDKYNFTLAGYGLESLVEEPTRFSNSVATCIDHLYFRSDETTVDITPRHSVQHLNITDHSMITLHVTLPSYRSNLPNDQAQYDKTDIKTLKEILSRASWTDTYKCSEVNAAFDCFLSTLEDAITSSTKTITPKVKSAKQKLKPWLNNSLLNRIRRKNALYRKVQGQPYNTRLLNYYRRYRNCLINEISLVKANYYQETFNSIKGNSRDTWNTINNLIGRSASDRVIKMIKLDSNEIITDKLEIANKLNEHFVKSGNIAQGVNGGLSGAASCNTNQPVFHHKLYSSSMFFSPTSPSEIENVVKSLKSRKAPGIDGMKTETIKIIIEYISEALAFIYNLSMVTGVYPEHLKKTVIIPIHKTGNRDCLNNYRPIALLSVFAKILEKLIRMRLSNYLTKINYLSKMQFGFRKGLRIEDAMLNLLEPVYEGINKNKKVASLFLDIRKAFDSVNHSILLDKLSRAGVRGVCRDWFESFLTNRTQQVRILGGFSAPRQVECGVPQGSGLSTELFLIFINDLCDGKMNGKLTSFADDTALTYGADSREQLDSQIHRDIQNLTLWFHINALKVNVEKTKLLYYKLRPNVERPLAIKMHNMGCAEILCNCGQIEEVTHLKYLGITIDSRLSWGQHIANLKREIMFTCHKFYHIRNLCPTYVMDMLYYALVQSRLQYGIVVWGGAYLSEIRSLIVGQKFVIRTIEKKPRTCPSLALFREKKILPLRHLYFYKVLEAFFIKSGQHPINYVRTNYTLRSTDIIRPPKPNKEVYRRFFSYVAPRVFGTLPSYIKHTRGVKRFRIEVQNWLLKISDIESLFSSPI